MDGAARLIVLGASHHATPLCVRERLAIAPERAPGLLRSLVGLQGVREALLLNTCNRLEIYAVTAGAGSERGVEELLCGLDDFPGDDFLAHRYSLRDEEAVRHLVAVSAGADSQLVGETEILRQVKDAYAEAVALCTVGPVLNRVFQKAFQAAKFIRTHTPIGEGQINVATVATDLAQKIFGALESCRVLIIGTGEVGEKTVKALHSRGVRRITVVSRRQERALAFSNMVGASAAKLEDLPVALPEHDIVIGCSTAPGPIVSAAAIQAGLRARKLRPLFLIDLGIPRNVEPAAGELDSVFLYDLDDLARIADENLATRRAAVERCRQLARERSQRIWEHLVPRLHGAPAEIRPAALVRPRESAT